MLSPKNRKRTLLLNIVLVIYIPIFGQLYIESLQPSIMTELVTEIFKDSKGLMWVGTTMGLYSYDGHEFVTFTTKPQDNNSISDNHVICITEDNDGFLWIGTMEGLNKFDRTTNSFTRYYTGPSNQNSLISNSIRCIYVDNDNYLWIGNNGGIVSLDPSRKNYKRFLTNVKIRNSFEVLQSHSIVAKDNNTLWIGSWKHGLIELDKASGKYKLYLHESNNPNSIAEDNISGFYYEKQNGKLWIGHYDRLISVFDVRTGKFTEIGHQFYKKGRILNVMSMIRNHDKKLWFASDIGLLIFDELKGKFDLQELEKNILLPKNPSVNKLLLDSDGIVWIGANKLYFHNTLIDRFSKYIVNLPKENKLILQNYAKTFYKDKFQRLWIGTFSDGIIIIEKTGKVKRIYLQNTVNSVSHIIQVNDKLLSISTSSGLFFVDVETLKIVRHITHDSNNPNSLFFDIVGMSYPDSEGNLWMITQESVDRMNLKTGKFVHFTKNNPNGISYYKGTSITEDKQKNIWIGTFNGLNRYNLKTSKFTNYFNNPNGEKSISKSYISDIVCTNNGDLWITTTKGLNKFNYETESFTKYFENSGFASDIMGNLIEDKNNNLWISTNLGLSIFSPKTGKVVNFDSKDGLNPNTESIYIDMSGDIFVGGKHYDYYGFNPDKIVENKIIPPVIITDFKIYNKSIKNSNDEQLTEILSCIYSKSKITLHHDQSVFSIVFSALNYTNGDKNQFKYKLEGFDKEWILTDSKRREAAYTNLNPGKYTFRVIASNNDGYWNEEGVTIQIEVLPPFWLSWYAFIFYTILVAGILLYMRNRLIKRELERHRIATEKMEAERIHETDQLKLRFFSNISHELRTPLTLILGPVDRMTKAIRNAIDPVFFQNQLQLVYRNSLRLEHLISEIMDTFKVESGSMKLKAEKMDIVSFIQSICNLFQHIADDRNLTFRFESDVEQLEVWFDPEKLEKVIYNLLSNAFKFTTNGELKVQLSVINNNTALYPNGYVQVTVSDTGCGIAADELEHVFKRFFQANNQSKTEQEGTGLGMALTKELVELHKGNIDVKSTINEGTQYIFCLQLGQEHFDESNLYTPKPEEGSQRKKRMDLLISTELTDAINEDLNVTKSKLPLLLIVEDNKDLRIYLKDLLKDKFKIEIAANGKAGLDKTIELMPDLVVSDVMMPVMDGIEMTKQIKSNPQICHIPVILLTARDSVEYKIEGLETGAFDYITKPFNEDILLLKIRNIQKNKEALSKFYIDGIKNNSFDKDKFVNSDVFIPSSDKMFVDKLKKLMEENIQNPNFSVDILASAVNMSVRNLNRKMNALLRCSALDLMTELRLNKAKILIENSDLNIAQIAFDCGFYDSNYFGKCFKKHYGNTPKDYRQLFKSQT